MVLEDLAIWWGRDRVPQDHQVTADYLDRAGAAMEPGKNLVEAVMELERSLVVAVMELDNFLAESL